MTCRCRNKLDELDGPHAHVTEPNEYCPWCAEKHIGTASSLAREHGYEAPNLGYVAGELNCASWHLVAGPPEAKALADAVRELRNRIQAREATPGREGFAPYLIAVSGIIEAEMAKEREQQGDENG